MLFFHQAQVKKESGAEGDEEIEDFQEALRIFLYIYQLSSIQKNLCTISFLSTFMETALLYSLDICYSEIFSKSYILPSLKYLTYAMT